MALRDWWQRRRERRTDERVARLRRRLRKARDDIRRLAAEANDLEYGLNDTKNRLRIAHEAMQTQSNEHAAEVADLQHQIEKQASELECQQIQIDGTVAAVQKLQSIHERDAAINAMETEAAKQRLAKQGGVT
jgi:TolA-binding protein